jgi:hypothetical protein
LLISRQYTEFITTVGLETLQAMASPDFWVGMDSAQEQKFPGGASTNEDYARSLRHDARQQIGDFRIGKSDIAVGGKWSKSAVIIEEKNTSGGGP